jgi:hypothetical protein
VPSSLVAAAAFAARGPKFPIVGTVGPDLDIVSRDSVLNTGQRSNASGWMCSLRNREDGGGDLLSAAQVHIWVTGRGAAAAAGPVLIADKAKGEELGDISSSQRHSSEPGNTDMCHRAVSCTLPCASHRRIKSAGMLAHKRVDLPQPYVQRARCICVLVDSGS